MTQGAELQGRNRRAAVGTGLLLVGFLLLFGKLGLIAAQVPQFLASTGVDAMGIPAALSLSLLKVFRAIAFHPAALLPLVCGILVLFFALLGIVSGLHFAAQADGGDGAMTDWGRDPNKDSTGDAIHDSIHRDINEQIRRGRDRHPFHGVIWGAVICVVGRDSAARSRGLHIRPIACGASGRCLSIVAGAARLTQPGRRAWGVLLMVIGALLQLENLDLLRFRWADIWPLVIICVGLMMIWNAIEARKVRVGTGGSSGSQRHRSHDERDGDLWRRRAPHQRQRFSPRVAERDFRWRRDRFPRCRHRRHRSHARSERHLRRRGNSRARKPGASNSTARLCSAVIPTRPAVAPVVPDGPKRKTLFITGTTCFGGVEVKN